MCAARAARAACFLCSAARGTRGAWAGGRARLCGFRAPLRPAPARACVSAAPPGGMDARAAARAALPVAAAAGTPAVVARLQDAFRDAPRDPAAHARLVAAGFPHALDGFQVDAMEALCERRNVILSAPTGSGKTVVGEMAILLALARGLRVFYTTPLKALSNQKFKDFQGLFGEDRVGLLTGDVNVNRDAAVVVMTTEVYRNMLYADAPAGGGGALLTDDVFAVCFDEFHYINDPDRGTTWEESVVNSPSHVLLVALSATMANTRDVRDWFADVQGPTALIESDHRPVPLNFSFCQREGVVPLFDDRDRGGRGGRGGRPAKNRPGFGKPSADPRPAPRRDSSKPKLHPDLLAAVAGGGEARGGRGERRRGRDQPVSTASVLREYDRRAARQGGGAARRGGMRGRRAGVPSYPFVVRSLRRRDMLPAIVFIFSRNGCDQAAVAAASERECLVNEEEAAEIRRRVDAFVDEHADLVNHDRLELVMQGIASHHAGLLPLWKAFVEELFQDGLIKVVFATETLAAGINMPARTTVISCLSKRRGAEGIAKLTTSEVLQMAGRAGRRGKDVVGYSVIMQSPFEGPVEAFRTVTAKVDALRSHFTPSYGMVLNLLQSRSLDDAQSLVQRSFGSFLRRKRQLEASNAAASSGDESDGGAATETDEAAKAANEIAALEAMAEEARGLLESVDEKSLTSFVKANERVKAERRALSYLVRQSRQTDVGMIEDALTFAPPGTRVLLRGERRGTGENDVPVSKGSVRRRKRRALAAALEAAGSGDSEELRAHFMEDDEVSIDSELNDPLDEATGDRKLVEAVLLDIGPDFGISMLFAAVGADKQLHFFTHEHVEQLYVDGPPVNVDEVAPDWGDFDYPERSEWKCVGLDQYVAPVPAELESIWEHIVSVAGGVTGEDGSADAPRELDEKELHPEVYIQRQRLSHAKSLVMQSPLYGDPAADTALRARRALLQLDGLIKDRVEEASQSGSKAKRRRRRKQRATAGGEESAVESEASAQEELDEYADGGIFAYFMSIVSVAQTYGFIDDEHCVTALGECGSKVRSDNELWATVALMDPALEDASPVHLSAVVSALLCEGMRADAYIDYEPCPESVQIIAGLRSLQTRLLAMQDEAGVGFPVALELDHAGLVEAWASGTSWAEVLSNTSLQEGDVCRILRRTLDLLRQIPHLPLLSDEVRLNARRAVTLFDRFPVVDDRTYVVRENEKDKESVDLNDRA